MLFTTQLMSSEVDRGRRRRRRRGRSQASRSLTSTCILPYNCPCASVCGRFAVTMVPAMCDNVLRGRPESVNSWRTCFTHRDVGFPRAVLFPRKNVPYNPPKPVPVVFGSASRRTIYLVSILKTYIILRPYFVSSRICANACG